MCHGFGVSTDLCIPGAAATLEKKVELLARKHYLIWEVALL
jgi:hypothetical protein